MSFAKAETKNFTINLPKAYLTKSEIVSPIFYANGSGTITRTANLTSFTACQGVASSTQTITISASSLNASTTVNLTAPTGFEISGTSTGTYSTSLVFAQTSAGTLTTTTVFIRLSASASAGTYSGSLSIASDGANQDLLLSMPSSTVTSLPTVSPITGSLSLCINGSTTLTNSTSGGTWTSSATGIANINTSTGLVQALSAGNVTMTYTVRSGVNSACTNSATAVMVVTAPPTVNAIAGTFSTCIGGTTTLTNATTGGTWSSSAIGIATINATTGLVQGVAAGNATITYTVASGVNSACTSSVTAIVAVNALPTIGTIDPIANVLTNATSFSVTIPSTTGSPDRFSITAGTPVLASFVAVTDGAISGTGTSTSINITLPTSKTAGNYGFTLRVKKGSTGCESAASNISLNIAKIVTSGTISAFTTCVGTASTSQSFTVTSSDLTNNLRITAPSGYEVSRTSSSSGFQDSVVLVQSSGSIAATTIYVRIKASASTSATTFGVRNISLESTGSTTVNLSIPASTINAVPTLTVSGNNFYTNVGTNLTLTGSATPALSNAWASSNVSVGSVSSSTTTAVFVPVANGSTDITYKNSVGCTITKTIIVGPAIPSLSSVIPGQAKNYLRWTIPTTPPTAVDSIQVHRSTDSLGTYTKVATVLNDVNKINSGINSYGKPVNISQYTYLGSFNGSEYYVSNPNLTQYWTDARNTAIAEGGQLVSLETPQEAAYFQGRLNALLGGASVWAGGYQINKLDEPKGNWYWVNGKPMTMDMPGTNFGYNSGEPNGGGEDYLEVYGSGWNDLPNEITKRFVIEYDGKASLNNPDYTDNNLTNGTKYFYKLSSFTKSNAAVSGFSNIKSATPQVGVKLPNSIITKTVSNVIKLEWTNETGQATGNYEIHRSLDTFKTTSFIVKTLANTTTSFLDSNLGKQVYSYRIKAVDANGVESAFSDIITAQKVVNKIYVATTGNDTNLGSADSPLKTLSKALSNSFTGDTIVLARGTYTNAANLNIGKQVFITSNYLTTKDSADITGTIITGGNDFTLFSGSSAFTINGLTIQNHRGLVFNPSSFIAIYSSIIKNNGNSSNINNVVAYLRNNSILSQSRIESNFGVFTLEGSGNRVEQNFFYRNKYSQESNATQLINGWKGKTYITNNLFVENGNDFTNNWDGFRSAVIEPGGWGGDSTFIINNTFIKNKGLAIHVSLSTDRTMIIANNLIYNPAGDFMFFNPNNNSSRNRSTIFLNNTLTDSLKNYKSQGFYNVSESGNIYGQDISRMYDTVSNKLKSNFIGIKEGVYDLLNKSGISYYKVPLFDFYKNVRTTNIDIGAEQITSNLPSPILDNVEGGDNLNTIIIYKPYNGVKISGFSIYRDTKEIVDSNITLKPIHVTKTNADLKFIDTTVNNGIKYFYRVKSNLIGTTSTSEYSNQISVIPNIPPSRVDSLFISSAPRSALLTWNKLNTQVKYLVLGGKNKDSLNVIANGVDTNFYKVTDLVANTNYWFALKTIDSGGAVSKTSNFVQLKLTNSWYVDTLPNAIQIGSNEYPFNNLQLTINNAKNGDTILVKPGVYASFKVTNKSILIKATGGPSKTSLSDVNKVGYLVRIDGNTSSIKPYPVSVISGFSISDFAYYNNMPNPYPYGVINAVESTSPIFENCIIQNNKYKSTIGSENASPTFVNCIISNNENLFWVPQNDTTSLNFRTTRFVNSNIVNNSSWGYINTGNVRGKMPFLNCIIWGNDRATMLKDGSSENHIVANSIVDDKVYSLKPGNINKDPLFDDISSGSYQLSNSSPALGKGAPFILIGGDTLFAATKDFEYNARPLPAGSTIDIGAYENKNYFAAPTLLELNRDINDKKILSITFSYDSALSLSKYQLFRDTLKSALDTVNVFSELAKATTQILDTINNGKVYYYALKLVTTENKFSGLSNIKNSNDTINVPAVNFVSDTASIKYNNASSRLKFNLVNLSSDSVNNKYPHLIFYDDSYRLVDTNQSRIDQYDTLYVLNSTKGNGNNSIKFNYNAKIKLTSKPDYYQKILPPFNINFDDEFDIPIIRRRNTTDDFWGQNTEIMTLLGKVSSQSSGLWDFDHDSTTNYYGVFKTNFSQIVQGEIPSNSTITKKISYSQYSQNPNIRDDADYIDGNFDGKQEYVVSPMQLKWASMYTPTNNVSYHQVNATLKLVKFIDINNDGLKDIFATSNDNWQIGLNSVGGSPLMVFVSNKKIGSYELFYTNVSLDYSTSLYIGALKNLQSGIYAIARSSGSSAYNTFKFDNTTNRFTTYNIDYKLKVNLQDGRFDVADVNGDGFPDIAQFANSGAIQIYLNNQLDGFKNVSQFENPFYRDGQGNNYPYNFRLLDLNNDGYKDLVWNENASSQNTYYTARILRALIQTPIKSITTPTLAAPKNLVAVNNGYEIKLKWDRVLNQASNSINTYNVKIDTTATFKNAKLNTFHNYRASNSRVPIVLDGMKFGSYVDSVTFTDNALSSTKPYTLALQTVNPDGYVSAETQITFTPKDVLTKSLSNVLPGLSNARLAWGDYNNDGLMDLAVMGRKEDGTSFTAVYQNKAGTLTDLGLTNLPLLNGDLKWADINNDGWLDLLAVGQYSASKNKVQLFTNRKSFFEITEPSSIPALRNSAITFGDHDANGTIDLVMIGADSLSNARSYLLNNDGKGNFTVDNSSQIVPSMCDGDIRFIDFDLDGDLDLIYAGSNKLDQATAVGIGGIKVNTLLDPKNTINYINSFNTNYVQGLNLANAKFDLGDVDNDGDMDIVLIGTNQNGGSNVVASPIVKMIKNLTRETRSSNNYNNYINTQESIIDSVDQGSVKFADYNNDGLLDLAYTGTNKLKSPTTKILLNLGGFNNFDTVRNVALPQYSSSTIAWADYDNTGTVDLVVAGESKGVSALSVFINNQGDNKNAAPKTAPKNLKVTDFGLGRVMLSWTAPEDDRSTKNSLYYQIRVGTTAGGSDIMTVPVSKVNGKYKLLTSNTTLISGSSYYLELMPGKYYWSVMAIDNNFESSDFSEEANFSISYPWRFVNQGGLIDRRIKAVDNPAFAWADFNNDGLSDFIYLGNISVNNGDQTGIYQNKKNKFEKVSNTLIEGLPGLKNIEVKCMDINADGFIDIIIAGEHPTDYNSSPTFRVYQNQNNNFRFTDVTSKFNVPQVLRTPKLEFSDFDNDGYLDMIYGGTLANGTGTVNIYKISKDTSIKTTPNYAFKVTTLRNNLTQLINANDPQNIQFAFGDLNKDKTFDLITTYEGAGFARFTDIYTNVFDSASNSNIFSKFTGFTLPKIKNGKVELVDFNNDGLLDIAMTGYATGIGEIFNVYQNNYTTTNGLNFINVTTPGLQPVQNSKTTWGDYNGDGFPDVIFSGDRDGFGYVTKMATSSKGPSGFTQFNELATFPFGNYSKLTPSMGDISGDGQLGFVLVGSEKDPLYPTTLYKSFRILQNVRNAASKVVMSTSNIQSNSFNQRASLSNSSNYTSSNIQPFAADSATIDQALYESSYVANAAPSSPALNNLNVVKKRDKINYLVQFNWKKAKDDNTPTSGLTYSLSVGTTYGTSDVVNVESDLATGVQKKPQDGNIGKDTSWQISLPPGKYYYSVQAVDASFAGSNFSERKMFTLTASGDAKEVTPPSDILFNDSTNSSYYFRKGDSANFKVLLKAISKDATAKYKVSLETGTSSIFKLDATTNTVTVNSKLTDTLYKLIVKGADTLGSDLVKTFNIYVRQSADKILVNNADISLVQYANGIDSSLLVTSLQAAYSTAISNASSNFVYKLVNGSGDLNNALFIVRDNVIINRRKLNSADTLTVRVSAIDDFGINTDKIIKFISNCVTKPSLAVVASPVTICSPGTINLTDTNYRKGSLGAFNVNYYSDPNEITILKDSTKIATAGTYYIKATNAENCSVIKPITVVINPKPASPVVAPLALCTNSAVVPLTAKASAKSSLNWYGTSATGGTAVKTAPTPVISNPGVASYYVSQVDSATGCESDRAKIDLTVNLAPVTPTLARDTAGNLVPSVSTGIKWYRDGVLIDSTSAKLKPTIASNYTLRVTNAATGCMSAFSAPYYFLVTDIIRLSWDEFIKLTPNPFINFVNIDFVVKGHQRMNIEVFSAATGAKVATRMGVTAGSRLTFNELNAGIYLVRVATPDLKVAHQFKMVKL
jgi:hypothetical protein